MPTQRTIIKKSLQIESKDLLEQMSSVLALGSTSAVAVATSGNPFRTQLSFATTSTINDTFVIAPITSPTPTSTLNATNACLVFSHTIAYVHQLQIRAL